MTILFNDFKKQYQAKKDEFDGAIKTVLESGYYILGPKVAEFEKEFSGYIGSKYAIGVANGLEALQIGLMALGIGAGDEVITTSHSAVASSLAIIAVGAKPVFIDVDEYHHIDADKIEEKITERTKAILPVHLYGQSCDIAKIMELADRRDLFVIEDCSQAHGALFNGRKVGTFGDVACFSSYPTKNLGAFGDAGVIITSDSQIDEKCRMIRNYGQKNRYEHEVYGLNSRLDELQAAILLVQLKYLNEQNKNRQAIADEYLRQLSDITQIELPKLRTNAEHVYHLFVVACDRRDELKQFLEKRAIPTLIHYPIPIHLQKCFREYNNLQLFNTERNAGRILSLPIHPFMEISEISEITSAIREFYGI